MLQKLYGDPYPFKVGDILHYEEENDIEHCISCEEVKVGSFVAFKKFEDSGTAIVRNLEDTDDDSLIYGMVADIEGAYFKDGFKYIAASGIVNLVRYPLKATVVPIIVNCFTLDMEKISNDNAKLSIVSGTYDEKNYPLGCLLIQNKNADEIKGLALINVGGALWQS